MTYSYNQVPPTDDREIVKTLAFPFQLGPAGFPALSEPIDYAYSNIIALLMTSKGERVMRPDLGVNTMEYVFGDMTPIQQVRLANTVSNAIEGFVPGVAVTGVEPSTRMDEDGNTLVMTISYMIRGQSFSQQIEHSPERGSNG